MVCGFCCATAVTPGERVKVMLQSQRGALALSPAAAVRSIWREGGRRSLYRGWSTTVMREIPGSILWFTVLEGSASYLQDELRFSRPMAVLGSAVLAPSAFSAAALPFDRIKILQQSAIGEAPRRMDLVRQVWRAQGLRGFYVGWKPMLAWQILQDLVQLSAADKLRICLASRTSGTNFSIGFQWDTPSSGADASKSQVPEAFKRLALLNAPGIEEAELEVQRLMCALCLERLPLHL